jgi:flagellar biosynthesis component FlhA
MIQKHLERSDTGTVVTLPPSMQARIVDAVRTRVEQATSATRGRPPVLLTPPQIRPWVRRMIEAPLRSVAVMSYNEVVRGFEVQSHGMVTLGNEP